MARRPYLARQLNAPDRHILYYPLRDSTIGQGFFVGLLTELFPSASRETYLNALFTGKVLLLFDGYDEITLNTEQIELNTP